MMAVNALLGFAIPVFLCWWAVKKHQAKLSTILIGAGTFVVFALVLESIVHQIVLKGPSGAVIQGKTLYYALYGGLMAGLFEETGRFLSMKFLLKKEPTETKPGVSYGLGHGGVEMAIIFGLSMISTLTMAIPRADGHPALLGARRGKGPADRHLRATPNHGRRHLPPRPLGAVLRDYLASGPLHPCLGGRPEGREMALALPGRHPATRPGGRPGRHPVQDRRQHGHRGTDHHGPRYCGRRPRLACRPKGVPGEGGGCHHVIPDYAIFSKACARSAIRSSTCSVPMDRRIVLW